MNLRLERSIDSTSPHRPHRWPARFTKNPHNKILSNPWQAQSWVIDLFVRDSESNIRRGEIRMHFILKFFSKLTVVGRLKRSVILVNWKPSQLFECQLTPRNNVWLVQKACSSASNSHSQNEDADKFVLIWQVSDFHFLSHDSVDSTRMILDRSRSCQALLTPPQSRTFLAFLIPLKGYRAARVLPSTLTTHHARQ